ncbi:DUF386 family protein [Aliivibrio fischeri]|uniref:YhcH/YjgK/YiaL family protein n=1 Tax=Aliivibrio fischeri TaxID=668 RepID=UPI0012D88AD4|nr:YhcH/YjgK/YiaL family protein [Aliivibrio fischeri]MUK37662.1 DUF386 family protein [Aliivibrio fischeri]MUL07738.1 DUF386 family protein [Aliivibrio fischeri]
MIKISNTNDLGNDRLSQLIKQVLKLDLMKLEEGNHEIDAREFFVNRVNGETRIIEKSLTEVHKDFADVHIVLKGREYIGFSIEPASKTFMDENKFENDCELKTTSKNEVFITLNEGEFIYFPAGVWHRPMIAINNQPSTLEKVIIKIKQSYL